MGKALVAGIIVVLLIAVAGGGYYLMQNIDGIVKTLIEESGTESMGTDVKVADVKIDLGAGTATISGLTVANPPGFSNEPLLSLGIIRVAIDSSSLTRDVYVINRIDVSDVRLLAEQQGATTNVQALKDLMDDSSSGESGDTGQSSDVLLAIRQINFENGAMELRSDEYGTRQLELRALQLRDVGTPERGLTPEQVSDEIADQVLGQVRDAVREALKVFVRDKATSKIKEKLGDLFNR